MRYPHTPLLEAKLGERVEFVVITHGSRFHTFHIHGHRWLDRGTNRGIDTFTHNAGESTGFQLTAAAPPTYTRHELDLVRVSEDGDAYGSDSRPGSSRSHRSEC